MTADQKTKPTAGFWITVAVAVVLVAYPLSFGPARWLYLHDLTPTWAAKPIHDFFIPIIWAVDKAPDDLRDPYLWYLGLWG